MALVATLAKQNDATTAALTKAIAGQSSSGAGQDALLQSAVFHANSTASKHYREQAEAEEKSAKDPQIRAGNKLVAEHYHRVMRGQESKKVVDHNLTRYFYECKNNGVALSANLDMPDTYDGAMEIVALIPKGV